MSPQVIILLGPSGAGKTTIGQMLARHYGCQFINLEAFFLSRYPTYDLYRSHRTQAYHSLAAYIHQTLATNTIPVLFEEVGLSSVAQTLIATMQATYQTALIKVTASKRLCQQRVSQRATDANFPKSPDIVWRVHDDFLAEVVKRYRFAAEIDNEDLPEEVILSQLQHVFCRKHR